HVVDALGLDEVRARGDFSPKLPERFLLRTAKRVRGRSDEHLGRLLDFVPASQDPGVPQRSERRDHLLRAEVEDGFRVFLVSRGPPDRRAAPGRWRGNLRGHPERPRGEDPLETTARANRTARDLRGHRARECRRSYLSFGGWHEEISITIRTGRRVRGRGSSD